MATWNVPAQGGLATVIGQAAYGDTIIVQAGNVTTGPLVLPNKGAPPFPAGDNRNYITIQTSALSSLPATGAALPALVTSPVPVISGRVSPSNASLMPKITAPAASTLSCLATDPSAKYYRFVGIEFNCADGGSTSGPGAPIPSRYFHLRIDGTSDGQAGAQGDPAFPSFAQLPSFFQFDRCYIHAFDTQHVCLHGVLLWCLNVDVCNCYISGFNGQNGDAQGIQGIGPGPYNIINNYVEASTENIFFGRGDNHPSGSNNGNRPGCGAIGTAQSLVAYNSVVKNEAWRITSSQYKAALSSGYYYAKNLIEVKNGKNITIDHNYLENSFDGYDQRGTAFAHNIINYGGWEGAENIVWSNNVVNRSCCGIYIAWTFEGGNTFPITNAITIKNIKFQNNLFIGYSDSRQFGNFYQPPSVSARNTPLSLALLGTTPIQGLIVDHNTFVPAATQAVGSGEGYHGICSAWQSGTSASSTNGITGFQFTNNIVPEQNGFDWAPNGFQGSANPQDITNWKILAPSPVMGGNAVYTNTALFPTPATSPVTTLQFMQQFDPAHTNYNPSSLSALSLQSSQTLSFPTTNGGTITVPLYNLPTGSTFRATDGLNGGLAGADITQLAWAASNLTGTSTSVTSSVNPSTSGQSVTFTASVSGSGATGTVQFQADGNNIGNPVTLNGGLASSPSISSLTTGTHTITANYSGDATFASSSGSLTQTVNLGTQTATQTTIGTIAAVNYPGIMPVQVTVAPVPPATGIPTGNVSITIDGKPLPSVALISLPLDGTGKATFNVRGLQPGTHTFAANYAGNPPFAASPPSPSQTGVINVGPTTCSINVANEPLNAGQNASVTVTLTSP
jgi:hypothetical protein